MLVFSDTLLPTHRVRHLCSPYATPSDATPSDNLQHQQCRLLREWQEAPVAGQPHPTSQPAGIQLAHKICISLYSNHVMIVCVYFRRRNKPGGGGASPGLKSIVCICFR